MPDIRPATAADLSALLEHDRHIDENTLEHKIARGEILVLSVEGKFAGWLRWNYFWDEHPFMNLLFLLPEYRGKGCGRLLVQHWEALMKDSGHETVMTSTQANECAQFFYRRLGYEDVGSFALPGDPLELILSKAL